MGAEKRPNGTGSVSEVRDGRYGAMTWIDGKRVYRYRQARKDAELITTGKR